MSIDSNTSIDYDVMEANGWILVHIELPKLRVPVLTITVHGGVDVCYLSLDLNDKVSLIWVNDMRCQHTNGKVVAWQELPKFK